MCCKRPCPSSGMMTAGCHRGAGWRPLVALTWWRPRVVVVAGRAHRQLRSACTCAPTCGWWPQLAEADWCRTGAGASCVAHLPPRLPAAQTTLLLRTMPCMAVPGSSQPDTRPLLRNARSLPACPCPPSPPPPPCPNEVSLIAPTSLPRPSTCPPLLSRPPAHRLARGRPLLLLLLPQPLAQTLQAAVECHLRARVCAAQARALGRGYRGMPSVRGAGEMGGDNACVCRNDGGGGWGVKQDEGMAVLVCRVRACSDVASGHSTAAGSTAPTTPPPRHAHTPRTC